MRRARRQNQQNETKCIETRSAPALLGATHRAFTFYLGNPFSSVHECQFSTNYSCPPSRSRRRPLEKDTGSDPEDWHRVLFSWHMGSTANMITTTDQTDVTD